MLVFHPSVRLTFALLCLVSAGIARGEGPKYTDPDKTDSDFAIQGEYSGRLVMRDGEARFGVQIIALGQGKFQAVAFPGGLPGDGWSGERRTDPVAGAMIDGRAVFVTDTVRCEVQDGVLSVADASGRSVGQLRRVERTSPTLGQKPPEDAVVLFDGSSADAWHGGRMTDDGLLMQGATSHRTFGDHHLHIEFRLPYQPEDRGQGRGNSGLYLQGRYEIQMLDSFGLEGRDNECGGIYSVKGPDVNMCFPPLTWQTYDIDFTAARYDSDGTPLSPPRMTVRHNGVLIHDNVPLPPDRSTTAAPVEPGPEPGPVFLQDHGCPVRYRNIWVIEK
jgi:hypothetical protein